MRSNFALPENFSDQNDENECDVAEAPKSEFWEDVTTAEDGVITANSVVCTLRLSVHDFFKANFSAKKVASKVGNVAKNIHKQNI